MKKKILALCLLTTALAGNCQINDFIVPLNDQIVEVGDMIKTNDGNFIVAGNSAVQAWITVESFTSSGTSLWSCQLQGHMEWHTQITERSNGNLLIPSNNGRVFELSPEGGLLGAIMLPDSLNALAGKAVELPDKSLIVTEMVKIFDSKNINILESFLVKYDQGGNVTKRYATGLLSVYDIRLLENGNLLASLYAKAVTDYKTVVIEYSQNLNVIQNISFPDKAFTIVNLHQIDNQRYFAAGHTADELHMYSAIGIFNGQGNIMHYKRYPQQYIRSLTQDPAGQRMYALTNAIDTCAILTLDYSGNLLNEFFYDDSLKGQNIIYDDEALYIACHYWNADTTPPRSRLVRISTDILESQSLSNKETPAKIVAYPNPASGFVVFERSATTPANDRLTIRIFDVTGQEIDSFILGSEKQIIQTDHLKPGLYFYEGVHEKEKLTGKFFVLNHNR
ncbi:MAG: T9SS type A sorting domain-containing protein [Bacteroidales bacterium]